MFPIEHTDSNGTRNPSKNKNSMRDYSFVSNVYCYFRHADSVGRLILFLGMLTPRLLPPIVQL